MSITNNDSDENPYNFALTGSGTTAPEINVKQSTTSIPDNTGSFSFGSVLSGVPKAVTFTVENLGNAALTLTGSPRVMMGGTNAGEFAVTVQPASPVNASSSTSFVVTFTPTATGVRTATVSLANNDSDENPYDFTLTGTGTMAPEINVKQNTTNLLDNTGNFSFGSVLVNNPKPVTFTVENLGNMDLNLTGNPRVVIGGTNAGDFVVTTDPASPVGAFSSTTLVITFTPGGGGTRTATLSLANDDSDENPYNFALTGSGGKGV